MSLESALFGYSVFNDPEVTIGIKDSVSPVGDVTIPMLPSLFRIACVVVVHRILVGVLWRGLTKKNH